MKRALLFAFAIAALSAQNPPPHYAWTGDKVHEIRLRFKQSDYWTQLVNNYLGTEIDATYLEASIEWGPYKFDSVGVRFKGNSSYRVSTDKKPFRIKLNEFVKGQKIDGIGAFNLSNSSGDGSMVREPLYYEMARELGLKTPRTNYAALYINDVFWGTYVLGEVENSDFLKNYFGSKEDTGNLYKGNIGAVFNYLGTDKATYKEVWEKQTNEEADDWSDLIELCRIIGETPAAELKAKLEPIMDIDSFLTAIALDNATVNLDSYVGMGQNFNIYRRPSDNKWVWIVWDPSLAFGSFGGGGGAGGATTSTQLALEYVQTTGGTGGGGGGQLPPGGGQFPPPGGGQMPPGGGQIPGGGGGTAVNTTGRPLASKLWEIPEYKERYRQIYKSIVEKNFDPNKLVARANTLRALIRPYVAAETKNFMTIAQFDAAMTTTSTTTPGQGGGGFGTGPALQPFIQDRVAWLKTQFASLSYPTATLSASVNRLNFTGADAAAQTVDLKYSGVNTPPTYSVYTATATGGNWLKLNVTSGGLPGAFTVSVDVKGLDAGAYEGTVTAYLGGATPVVIPVSLTIGTVPAPTLSAVVNAASYNAATIAPGQLVTIFGSNLASGGLKVTFDGTAAQLLYTTANQIGAIVPLTLAGKTSTVVQIAVGSQTSAAVTKAVATTAPGIFTANASGTGQGAIINQASTVNSASAPAPKGSIIAIYLTGGGASMAVANTTVTIGGQAATVAYAGAAPGSVQGLYQVNATVPASVASGAVPVVVTVSGVASQSGVTVAIQ